MWSDMSHTRGQIWQTCVQIKFPSVLEMLEMLQDVLHKNIILAFSCKILARFVQEISKILQSNLKFDLFAHRFIVWYAHCF